jgi:hypothetical protein
MQRTLRIFGIAIAVAMLLASIRTAAAAPTASQTQINWDPRIIIVWPHDGYGRQTGLPQSRAVNVGVRPSNQVDCLAAPFLTLFSAKDNEPAQLVQAVGELVMSTIDDVTFPALKFDNVPADLAAEPNATYRFILAGPTEISKGLMGNVWVHGADARTFDPVPVTPDGYGDNPAPEFRDARIQIVWPHDEQGQFTPVARAGRVNIVLEVFEHGTLKAVPPDQHGDFLYSPLLFLGEGGGPLERWSGKAEKTMYEANGRKYPRWVFNDVPVNLGRPYHFVPAAPAIGSKSIYPYSSIWTHAADPAIIAPTPAATPAYTAPVPVTDAWQTAINAPYGYRIRYPPDWFVRAAQPPTAAAALASYDVRFTSFAEAPGESMSSPISPKGVPPGHAAVDILVLHGPLTGYQPLGARFCLDTVCGVRKDKRPPWSCGDDSQELYQGVNRLIIVQLVKDDHLYQLSATINDPPAAAERYAALAESIIQSFQFIR